MSDPEGPWTQVGLAEKIADVCLNYNRHPDAWPKDLRADLHAIRDRYAALKWDSPTFELAMRQALAEWTERHLERVWHEGYQQGINAQLEGSER